MSNMPLDYALGTVYILKAILSLKESQTLQPSANSTSAVDDQ